MAAFLLSGNANITHDTADPSAVNEYSIALAPNPIEFLQEHFVVCDVA
jgi:hypothetical protein